MAEPTEVILGTTNEGELRLRGNELLLYDLVHLLRGSGDPVAFRFRSHNETKGKLSVDKFVDGAWREIGLVIFKEDERGRTNPAHAGTMELRVLMHQPGKPYDDHDPITGENFYPEVFAIRHDGLWVRGQQLGLGSPGRVTRFYTDGGKFMVNWQDDTGQPTGTIYRVDETKPESEWVAVGYIPIEMLPATARQAEAPLSEPAPFQPAQEAREE